MLDSLKCYQLRYADREHIQVKLEFNAICESPFTSSSHFDQPTRVTGEIVLRGEKINVNCLVVRDRSWGWRMGHRGNHLGYTFGTLSEQEGFCVFVIPSKARCEQGGRKATIKKGWRTVVRDANSHIVSMQIEAEEGCTLKVSGKAASRMVLCVPRGICPNSFLHFRFESGVIGHAEDQDVRRTTNGERHCRRYGAGLAPNPAEYSLVRKAGDD